ncbi:MAG TPA: cytochrome b/b6 domain-containing protein [Caldimonas sp.]|nr:cytochrome b/b6 domain-containing protein [Caldimonas sp.]
MTDDRITAPLAAYDRNTVVLHWLTAALVACGWLLAQFIDEFPTGTARTLARSVHVSLGLVLALVLVVRLSWRRRGGLRLEPQPGSLGRLAVITHAALYALLVAVVVAGVVNVRVRGDDLFGLVRVPSFAPGDKALRRTLGEVHGWLANVLLILAGAHAAAGLWHHWALKDGVLHRMWTAR